MEPILIDWHLVCGPSITQWGKESSSEDKALWLSRMRGWQGESAKSSGGGRGSFIERCKSVPGGAVEVSITQATLKVAPRPCTLLVNINIINLNT